MGRWSGKNSLRKEGLNGELRVNRTQPGKEGGGRERILEGAKTLDEKEQGAFKELKDVLVPSREWIGGGKPVKRKLQWHAGRFRVKCSYHKKQNKTKRYL